MMRNEACEDRINIYEYDLEKMSKEALEGMLALILDCKDCQLCAGQVEYLRKLITDKS